MHILVNTCSKYWKPANNYQVLLLRPDENNNFWKSELKSEDLVDLWGYELSFYEWLILCDNYM